MSEQFIDKQSTLSEGQAPGDIRMIEGRKVMVYNDGTVGLYIPEKDIADSLPMYQTPQVGEPQMAEMTITYKGTPEDIARLSAAGIHSMGPQYAYPTPQMYAGQPLYRPTGEHGRPKVNKKIVSLVGIAALFFFGVPAIHIAESGADTAKACVTGGVAGLASSVGCSVDHYFDNFDIKNFFNFDQGKK